MPEDWSFVRIGTTGVLKGESFSVVGRIRLQLINDYKNFWCSLLHSGQYVWLRESFASFAVLHPVWKDYGGKPSNLRANGSIAIADKTTITGDFVEKCKSIAFEGACGKWPMRKSGFFYIEGGTFTHAASFFVSGAKDRIFLAGQRTEWESLQLKNIFEWNEWK